MAQARLAERSGRRGAFSGMPLEFLKKTFSMDIEGLVRGSFAGGNKSPLAIDLGCGNGSTIREVKRKFPGLRVIGIDVRPDRDWRLPKGTGMLHHNVEFLKMHFHEIEKNLPANYADCIWSWVSVSYAPYPQEIFRQVHAVLKPGGKCLFHMGPAVPGISSVNVPLPPRQESAFVASLKKTGFTVKKPRPYIYFVTKKP